MLHSLLYAFARLGIGVLIYRDGSEARLRAEVLALRHQRRVLDRQTGGGLAAKRAAPAGCQPRSAQAILAAAMAWSRRRAEASAPGGSSCGNTLTRSWPATSLAWTRSG